MDGYVKEVSDLIDRYVYAVVKRLPGQQREDIEKELRGLIDDMLADTAGDEEPRVEDIQEVLKELGRPSMLAAKYSGEKLYLIGPEYFDLYILIMKIVVIVAAAGTAMSQIIGYIVTPPEKIWEAIGMFFAASIGAAVQSFAVITIIFAAIERFSDRKEKIKAPDWRPSDLPPIPTQKARISKSEPIIGIIFGVIAIILFNVAPWLIGANDFSTRTFVPLFNLDVLLKMMPLINAIFALGILKEVVRLVIGRYNFRLAAAVVIINILSLITYLYVFIPPEIWNMDFMMSLNALYGFEWAAGAEAEHVWSIVIKVIIGLAIFGNIIDTITTIVRAARHSERKVA